MTHGTSGLPIFRRLARRITRTGEIHCPFGPRVGRAHVGDPRELAILSTPVGRPSQHSPPPLLHVSGPCAWSAASPAVTCPLSREEVRAQTATSVYASGCIDEFVQANDSGAEAAMLTDFGERTAGRPHCRRRYRHDAAWNELAMLSTDTSHRVVEGASHSALRSNEHLDRQGNPRCRHNARNNEPLAT
jgi:hypothetical protein